MKWMKFEMETTTVAEDLVSEMLSELGVEGVEIIDRIPLSEEDKQRMFIDILPELPTDDGSAVLSFYMEPSVNVEELTLRIAEQMKQLSEFIDVGSGRLTISETEDTDWINNWKEFFKPFRVDDTIVIKPTWEELPERRDTDLVIEIDPGTAFGTGAHETTKLCIGNLKKYLTEGDRVLDVGCGSGILSILARKLGASYACAVDIDPIAVEVSMQNAAVNHLLARPLDACDTYGDKGARSEGATPEAWIEVAAGNVLADAEFCEAITTKQYDIVVANILADVIIPLSSIVNRFLRPGGLFISSGIIHTKREAVVLAIKENGLEIVEITTLGDWVSVVAKR